MPQATTDQSNPGLLAGLARVDITPPLGQPMGGFLDRLAGGKGGCEAVHDPLFARVLLLRTEETSIALVSIDLIMFSSAKVVEQAKERWNIDHVILCSSHTHAGPIPKTGGMVEWSNLNVNPQEVLDFEAFGDDPWFFDVERKVTAAIGEAANNTFAARLGSGEADAGQYVAHNRRVVKPDGSVAMLWSNPKRIPTSPVDNTLRVLRVDDGQGQLRALAVHYCCHPVVLGSKNLDISADFPGQLVADLEARNKGCMAMFLQGSLGDIDACDTALSGPEGHEAARRMGHALSSKADEIAANIRTHQPGPHAVLARSSMLSAACLHRPGVEVQMGITTLLLAGRIGLVSVSGEPFVQHQINLAAQSPATMTCLLGLAYNGRGVPWGLYLPTVQAHRQGGYGASQGVYLQSDTAQRVVEHGIQSLHALLSDHSAL